MFVQFITQMMIKVSSSEDAVFIGRGGVNKKDVWKDLLTQVERADITCVNTRHVWSYMQINTYH